MARSLLVLHGPNLNLLGQREPDIYGRKTLAQIDAELCAQAQMVGARMQTFQSNHEGDLVDRIQQAHVDETDFIIINPAAFTHTSVALRDALVSAAMPYIEVHLSNVHAREPFRRRSYFSDRAIAVICGLGAAGYQAALAFALDYEPSSSSKMS